MAEGNMINGQKPVMISSAHQRRTFSQSLKTRTVPASRVEQIAAELGAVEGKTFLEAMGDKKISCGMIHAALADAGVVVSISTLTLWRRLNNVK